MKDILGLLIFGFGYSVIWLSGIVPFYIAMLFFIFGSAVYIYGSTLWMNLFFIANMLFINCMKDNFVSDFLLIKKYESVMWKLLGLLMMFLFIIELVYVFQYVEGVEFEFFVGLVRRNISYFGILWLIVSIIVFMESRKCL